MESEVLKTVKMAVKTNNLKTGEQPTFELLFTSSTPHKVINVQHNIALVNETLSQTFTE